jgi:AAA domain
MANRDLGKELTESQLQSQAYLKRALTDITGLYSLHDSDTGTSFSSKATRGSSSSSFLYSSALNGAANHIAEPGDMWTALLAKKATLNPRDEVAPIQELDADQYAIPGVEGAPLGWTSAVLDINEARLRANACNPDHMQVEVFTDGQMEILTRYARHIDATELYIFDTVRFEMPEQLCLLVIAGPGAGKTTLFNALAALFQLRYEKYGSCKHRSASFTAKAAILLKDGVTLHQLGKLSAEKGSAANILFHDLKKPENIIDLRENLEGLQRLLVDEVSMCYPVLLGQLDQRFRQGLGVPGSKVSQYTCIRV